MGEWSERWFGLLFLLLFSDNADLQISSTITCRTCAMLRMQGQ